MPQLIAVNREIHQVALEGEDPVKGNGFRDVRPVLCQQDLFDFLK